MIGLVTTDLLYREAQPEVMSDPPDSDATFTGASPWPLFVAIGFALSELGVVLGLRPVSIAGLLLFVGSVAGILTEAGYISGPAKAIGVQAFVLVGIGILLITETQTGTTIRGQSIAIAGILCLVGALLWVGFVRKNTLAKVSTTETSETTSD
jgi:membrane-bound ClpP family serine protease